MELLTIKEFIKRFPILNRDKLASILGINESSLDRYISEKYSPREKTLEKMNLNLQKLAHELKNLELIQKV